MPVMITPEGKPVDVPEESVQHRLSVGFTLQTAEIEGSRLEQEAFDEEHSGLTDKVAAGLTAFARGATLGGSDALIAGIGTRGSTKKLAAIREANPTLSTGLEIAGGLVGIGKGGGAAASLPAARVTQLGSKLAKTEPGASLATKLGAAAKGGAAEGALTGVGQGVTELALSDDPLTIERVTSTLSSNALFGAAVGAPAGSLAKAAEIGLTRTKRALDGVVDRAAARTGVADDLVSMDARGLRAAKQAELDAIEATRAPARQGLADEIATFRKEIRDQKVWLATKGAKDAEVRAVTRRMIKSERGLDNILDDPKTLAERPQSALSALRRQEAALEELVTKHGDNVRATFATDTSGTRAAALDAVPQMLERNRALQQKIAGLTGAPSSDRLLAIQDAADALTSGGAKKGLAEQMAGGAVFGVVADAARMLPGGGFLAPLLGAKAANMVGDKVFGRFAKTAAEASKRTADAVGKFLDVTKRLTPAAPVLATKVLSAVRYGREQDRKNEAPAKTKLADHFKARAGEIRSQMVTGPDGKQALRPEARQEIAKQLMPVAAVNPTIADTMETIAARRIEFLAEMLPKRPDLGGIQTGPDNWQPSDMEMRTFARYAAAVEDPGGIEERLAAGTVTPEDADVMREVYPERYNEIKRQIIEALPTLRSQLPYQKRLALSIFSGIAVDPATSPRMLRVLQAQFADEEGSEGGLQAPMPNPQFGSVKAEKATSSQSRAG